MEPIGRIQSNSLLPSDNIEHLEGNDYLRDSHPINQKDVKKEIDDQEVDLFDSFSQEEDLKKKLERITSSKTEDDLLFTEPVKPFSTKHMTLEQCYQSAIEAELDIIGGMPTDPNYNIRHEDENLNYQDQIHYDNFDAYQAPGCMPPHMYPQNAVSPYGYGAPVMNQGMYGDPAFMPPMPHEMIKLEDPHMSGYYPQPRGDYYGMHDSDSKYDSGSD